MHIRNIFVLAAIGTTAFSSQANDLILIDGSSTVFPVTSAIAKEFERKQKGKTSVLVGVSGTGGGFKKFCRGELDISNASRPIKEKEKSLCASNGIEFIELPVALDAVTVVVNKNNNWIESMTVKELEKAWQAESEGWVNSWHQLNPTYPKALLTLYGPGEDSGTYDYFTEAVIREGTSRQDYHANEDDNVIVQGVAKDINSMAFFGLSYYEENRDKLKAIPISWNNREPVSPNIATIKSGAYQPLSRLIFIYVNKASADNLPFVDQFVHEYMDAKLITEQVKNAGYVPIPSGAYQTLLKQFQQRETGSRFNGPEVGVGIKELLDRQPQ